MCTSHGRDSTQGSLGERTIFPWLPAYIDVVVVMTVTAAPLCVHILYLYLLVLIIKALNTSYDLIRNVPIFIFET